MAWSQQPTSARAARLPSDWATRIRPAVLRRDGYQCTWVTNGRRCTVEATDVDHVQPMTDDHDLGALASLCSPHHAAKSAREGVSARAAVRAGLRRPERRHPGLA